MVQRKFSRFFLNFPVIFPELSLGTPEETAETATALSTFLNVRLHFFWWEASCTRKNRPGMTADFATRAAIYRSLRALRARNRKKVSKRVFLGVWRKVSKNTRKSQKYRFSDLLGYLSVFLDFFGYFLRLFSRPPKRPFLRLLCDFGPGGHGDFCKWRLGSQGGLAIGGGRLGNRPPPLRVSLRARNGVSKMSAGASSSSPK